MVMIKLDQKSEVASSGLSRSVSTPAGTGRVTEDPPVKRTRLEWNGVSGCRQIEIRRQPIADQEQPASACEESVVGEVCEPFS